MAVHEIANLENRIKIITTKPTILSALRQTIHTEALHLQLQMGDCP